MSVRVGHRAGMAIVRVEVERADSTGVLIRVRTVDDVTGRFRVPEPPEGEPFADVDAAVAYLREWLDRWIARA